MQNLLLIRTFDILLASICGCKGGIIAGIHLAAIGIAMASL